jgi:hypothetical protein
MLSHWALVGEAILVWNELSNPQHCYQDQIILLYQLPTPFRLDRPRLRLLLFLHRTLLLALQNGQRSLLSVVVGRSRLYGGMHFAKSVSAANEMCQAL